MTRSKLAKIIESTSIGLLAFLFAVQTSLAQAVPLQQGAQKSLSAKQIVEIYNRFETPEQMKTFTQIYAGQSQAIALENVFLHHHVSMKQKLAKLVAKGNQIQVVGAGQSLMEISASSPDGPIDQIRIAGQTIRLSSSASFESQLQLLERVITKKSTNTSRLEGFFFSEAHADDGIPDNETDGTLIGGVAGAFIGAAATLVAASLGVAFIIATGAPLVTILTGALVGAIVLGTAAHFYGKSLDKNEDKKLVVNCPKTPEGEMDFEIGGFQAHVSYSRGVPYNLDLKIPGKPEMTYFLKQNRDDTDDSGDPRLAVSGFQAAGKAAEVPPTRPLTETEHDVVDELHRLTAVCSHPEITGKFQDLLAKAQLKINERAPGSDQSSPDGSGTAHQAN